MIEVFLLNNRLKSVISPKTSYASKLLLFHEKENTIIRESSLLYKTVELRGMRVTSQSTKRSRLKIYPHFFIDSQSIKVFILKYTM